MKESPADKSGHGKGAGAIRLSGLRKTFDGGAIEAVNDIDLEVRDGEVLVLLGPSGCGKSTTLRMIAGLEMPTEGSITIGGEEVTHQHPRERDLSLVFQSYALYPHKTVYENLEFPLNKMDLTEAEKEEKIIFAAELLEIESILEKKPGQLSGGQRQRVAVGRTIVREPRVFLMDEPLSNLDAKLRVKARSEIRQLQQRLETTMVYVTHDQEEAMSIADRVAVMNDGDVVQVGTPEEIYRQPATEFVANFIGEPAMNFFDATREENGLQVQFGDAVVDIGLDVDPDCRLAGVRPEDLYVAGETTRGTGEPVADPLPEPIECTVTLREPLGHASELTLERDGETMTAWIRDCPDRVVENETVEVGFDRETIYVFDAEGDEIR